MTGKKKKKVYVTEKLFRNLFMNVLVLSLRCERLYMSTYSLYKATYSINASLEDFKLG